MFSTLKQPFPSFSPQLSSVVISIIAALTVFSVLYFLSPLGMDTLLPTEKLKTASRFGFITGVVSLVFTFVLPWLCPSFFDEKRWTVAHEIAYLLCLLFSISLANILLIAYPNIAGIRFSLFVQMLLVVVLIGGLPVALSVMEKQKQLLKKYQYMAADLSQVLPSKEIQKKDLVASAIGTPIVSLVGEGKNESLTLSLSDLLFISGADNYTRIVYLDAMKPKAVLYRTTLKKVAETLEDYPQIYRCHKTYFVNLCHVASIKGNSQGCKLYFERCEEVVPVSRSLNKAIRERLELLREGVFY